MTEPLLDVRRLSRRFGAHELALPGPGLADLATELRRLTSAEILNMYGPTETNVCTYFEIPATIPMDQTKPFPIGKACSET